jgi:hypothetical protein
MGDVRFEADVEKKAPIVKEEKGEKKWFGRDARRNHNKGHDGNKPSKPQKFTGACAELQGHVFKMGASRAQQLTIYNNTMEHMKLYIGNTCDPLVLKTIETGIDCNYDEPDDQDFCGPDGSMSMVNQIRFSKQLDIYYKKQDNLDKEKKQTFSLFLGHMDDELKSSAEEHPDWKQISADKSLLRLLEVLQSTSHHYKSTQEPIYALMTIKSDMLKLKQEPNQSVHNFKDRFDGMIEVCEVHGILIHDD